MLSKQTSNIFYPLVKLCSLYTYKLSDGWQCLWYSPLVIILWPCLFTQITCMYCITNNIWVESILCVHRQLALLRPKGGRSVNKAVRQFSWLQLNDICDGSCKKMQGMCRWSRIEATFMLFQELGEWDTLSETVCLVPLIGFVVVTPHG